MLLNNWIATNISEVGISAFDFYSIGHICMGIAIFLIFSLFYTIPHSSEGDSRVIIPLWLCFIFTVLCGIGWEYLENVYFIEWGIKFEDRLDSLPNMITDVILVGVGALGMWGLAHLIFENHKNVWLYYICGILGFIFWLTVYGGLRYLTYFVSS